MLRHEIIEPQPKLVLQWRNNFLCSSICLGWNRSIFLHFIFQKFSLYCLLFMAWATVKNLAFGIHFINFKLRPFSVSNSVLMLCRCFQVWVKMLLTITSFLTFFDQYKSIIVPRPYFCYPVIFKHCSNRTNIKWIFLLLFSIMIPMATIEVCSCEFLKDIVIDEEVILGAIIWRVLSFSITLGKTT